MLGSPIAQGRQAELYAWHERTVIKLYRAGIGGHVAEATALACLRHTNIATRLDDTVTVNGRIGLVLKRRRDASA